MEEIDPMAFNNGEEDLGLSMAHTFVNDGSNSKLYLPSKKTWKSWSNFDGSSSHDNHFFKNKTKKVFWSFIYQEYVIGLTSVKFLVIFFFFFFFFF